MPVSNMENKGHLIEPLPGKYINTATGGYFEVWHNPEGSLTIMGNSKGLGCPWRSPDTCKQCKRDHPNIRCEEA